MKIPIGLGIKWFRIPFMTLALVALLAASLLITPISADRDDYVPAPQELLNSHEIISYQLCMSKLSDPKTCNQIFLQETKVKNEINVRKEWLEKSMAAFENDAKALKDLPQYSRFAERAKQTQADYGKRRGRQLLNAENVQPQAAFSSLFRHGNLVHMIINVGLLILFGASVELWAGPTLFILCYLFGGFFTAVAYSRFAAPAGVEIFGSSGAIGVLIGMYTVLFSKARLQFINLSIWGNGFSSFMTVEKAMPIILAIVELTVWVFLIPSGSASFGIYFLGGLLGLVLGLTVWMIMKPNFQSLFPASAILFREVNWTRLSEFDLKLIEDAIRHDPDFVDLRLKYLRALDAILAKEPRNKEINFRRLRLAEQIGRDWYCHFNDREARRRTAATMEKLSIAFPWRALLYATPMEQARDLHELLVENGVGIPIEEFVRQSMVG